MRDLPIWNVFATRWDARRAETFSSSTGSQENLAIDVTAGASWAHRHVGRCLSLGCYDLIHDPA